jgi:hypothetical protein
MKQIVVQKELNYQVDKNNELVILRIYNNKLCCFF